MYRRANLLAGGGRATERSGATRRRSTYHALSSSRLYRDEKWHSGHSFACFHVRMSFCARTESSSTVDVISKTLPDGD